MSSVHQSLFGTVFGAPAAVIPSLSTVAEKQPRYECL